jgi:SAM-dependent methyltransferase
VLDLAAGSGRHVRLLRDCGFAVCAVDRDTTALLALAGPCCEVRRIDLETDDRRQLGDDYDGIIVTNYLHRPLLPAIARALAPGGVLISTRPSRAATNASAGRAIPISCFAPASCSKPLQPLRSSPSNRERLRYHAPPCYSALPPYSARWARCRRE